MPQFSREQGPSCIYLQHKLDVTYLCIDVLILYSDRIKLYVVMCKTEMIQLQLQQTNTMLHFVSC